MKNQAAADFGQTDKIGQRSSLHFAPAQFLHQVFSRASPVQPGPGGVPRSPIEVIVPGAYHFPGERRNSRDTTRIPENSFMSRNSARTSVDNFEMSWKHLFSCDGVTLQ